VTYDASAGKYKPKPGTGGATPGMLAIKHSTDFAWTQSPSTDLSTAGAKTATLASCPAGVVASETFFYVYIAGPGTPEAVKVTGGTCAGNGSSGTLQFTTANAHPGGYTISSATAGIQEASIAAKVDILSGNNYHYYRDGYVRVPPGIHQLYAPLDLVANDQTIDFSGAILKCNFDADCIVVGRSDSYGAFALLGLAAQAVKEAGDVAEAKGVNIVLDQQLIADIKALIVAIEEYAKTAGLQKPAAAK
jgi:hypothetical protein